MTTNITIEVEVYIRSYNLKLRTAPALTRSVLEVTYSSRTKLILPYTNNTKSEIIFLGQRLRQRPFKYGEWKKEETLVS